MENASKALLIAAAVLVVILIITIGIKIFSSTNDAQKVATDTGTTINDKTKIATDITISELSGKNSKVDLFNYGEGKTKNSVVPGNEITLTKENVTERFIVISNNNGKIVAMPKYNIQLQTNHPRQSSGAGRIRFSSSNYWAKNWERDENWGDINHITNSAININMEEKNDDGTYKNNIQKYIDAYKETLEEMGAEGINVRACTKQELDLESLGTINAQLGSTGAFWLGSCISGNYDCENRVWKVLNTGKLYNYYYNEGNGVRPAIEIN